MDNKTLFLDFDGVLFDTIMEVYLVNRYLFKGIDFLVPVDKKELSRYSKYKYLVYNIWMFYYYNPIVFNCQNEGEIVQEYNFKLSDRNLEKEEQFCSDFLNARKKLVENHYNFWKNLEIPYEFFFNIKKIYEEKNADIVVVSKKNKVSILERFSTFGFNLPENKVFAREALKNYSSKGEFLEEYMKKNLKESAIFVDDNMNNLKNINSPKIKTILALWGNNAPDDKGLDQKEAIDEIKKFLMQTI